MNLVKHDLSRLSDLTQLAKSTYASGEIISEDYLNWEYNQNPEGRALVLVADNGKEIVSQYLVIPKNYVFESKIIAGALSLNTITHPGYRGQGYFTKLAELTYIECEKKGINFTIGFPNANSVGGFLSKLKFKEIGRLPLLIKVINPSSAFFNFLFKSNSQVESEIELMKISQLSNFSKLDLIADGSKYLSFWNKFKTKNCITTDRTIDYLKWRYVDIPFRKYHLFKFSKNDEIVGIIVIRLKNIMGVRCGILVEHLALNNEISANKLINEIKRSKLDLIIATVPMISNEQIILRNAGFFKVPDFLMFKKLHMVIRRHNDNISDSFNDFKKWFITFGDYDIF